MWRAVWKFICEEPCGNRKRLIYLNLQWCVGIPEKKPYQKWLLKTKPRKMRNFTCTHRPVLFVKNVEIQTRSHGTTHHTTDRKRLLDSLVVGQWAKCQKRIPVVDVYYRSEVRVSLRWWFQWRITVGKRAKAIPNAPFWPPRGPIPGWSSWGSWWSILTVPAVGPCCNFLKIWKESRMGYTLPYDKRVLSK